VFVRGVSIRRDRLGSQATGADASRGFVRASRITVARGRQAVLSDSSFSLDPGHVVGLVAPNGCGKTTLLEVLAGNASLLKSGSIKIAGVPCSRNPQYMQCVFLVPGNADWMYSHLSPDEHLALVTAFWGQAAGRVYDDACSELAEFGHKAVRKLSQGMKQQVALTLAYVSGARCLLLDESMNALDPTHVKWHSHTLRQYANAGGTVLISSHILSTLEGLCDDYLFIEDGAVCSKRPDGTVADYYAETFEKASGNVLP
ncbi:MAG TPA: ATP-binding cassette domain-containing protein, partial [Enorma massiliensis]